MYVLYSNFFRFCLVSPKAAFLFIRQKVQKQKHLSMLVLPKKIPNVMQHVFPIFVLFTKAIENETQRHIIPGVIFPQLEKVWFFFLVISDDLNPFKIDLDENWPQPQSFVFLTVFKPELAIKPTWLIFVMMICTIYDHTSIRVSTRYPVIKLCNSKLSG